MQLSTFHQVLTIHCSEVVSVFFAYLVYALMIALENDTISLFVMMPDLIDLGRQSRAALLAWRAL